MKMQSHITILNGFGRLDGSACLGDWRDLECPGCTILEILMVDLNDALSIAEVCRYIGQSQEETRAIDSTIYRIAVACRAEIGDAMKNVEADRGLSQFTALIPTTIASPGASTADIQRHLGAVISALQSQTLHGLHLAELHCILGARGMFKIYAAEMTSDGIDSTAFCKYIPVSAELSSSRPPSHEMLVVSRNSTEHSALKINP